MILFYVQELYVLLPIKNHQNDKSQEILLSNPLSTIVSNSKGRPYIFLHRKQKEHEIGMLLHYVFWFSKSFPLEVDFPRKWGTLGQKPCQLNLKRPIQISVQVETALRESALRGDQVYKKKWESSSNVDQHFWFRTRISYSGSICTWGNQHKHHE